MSDEYLFSAFGFRWDRSIPPAPATTYTIERTSFHFHRMLPEFIWDAAVLDGSTLSYTEVKTLMEDAPIANESVCEKERIYRLAQSAKNTLALVKGGRFSLEIFAAADIVVALNSCQPFERALVVFLLDAFIRFLGGEKQKTNFWMAGVLMSNGMDPFSVPFHEIAECNERMSRFYSSKDATEMMVFLASFYRIN